MKQLSFFALLLLITGCETTGTLSPIAATGQTELMRDGRHTLVSAKKHTVIVVPADSTVVEGARGSLFVAVSNHSKHPIEVSPARIKAATLVAAREDVSTADFLSAGQNGQPLPSFETIADADTYLSSYQSQFPQRHALKVYTFDELVEEENERAAMEAVSIALSQMGDALAATNAGYQTGHGTFSTVGSPSGPTFRVYGHSEYNFAAAQAARNAAEAKNTARANQAMDMHEANMVGLKATILKEHTLLPGETYSGIVKIDLPSFATTDAPVPIVIDIEAGNETHRFVYKLAKSEHR